jgi:hypothetical protein
MLGIGERLPRGDDMNGFDLIIKPDEEDIDAAEVLVDGTKRVSDQ